MTRPKPIPISQTEAMWAAAERQAAWLIAEQRALREVKKPVAWIKPNVAEYAASMPVCLAKLLLAAQFDRSLNGWAVAEYEAARLRPLGLCEVRGRCLTAFGQALRGILNAA